MIPKILFHGTSAIRYAMIKKDGKMKADMPKHYLTDSEIHGYLYFTDNLIEGAICALNTYLTDQRMNYMQIIVKSHEKMKDGIILAVKTSMLKDNFEVDPEQYTVNQEVNRFAKLMGTDWDSTWYRHKGDIPMKYLFPTKYVPYSQWPDKTVDRVNHGIDMMEQRDLGIMPV